MKCPNCNVELVEEGSNLKCPKCVYSRTVHTPKGNKYVDQVNDRIKELLVMARLEGDAPPWQQQWIIIPKRNYDTNRIYNGINRWLLSCDAEISYITEKSIKDKGLTKKEDAVPRFVTCWIPPKLKKEEKALPKEEQEKILKKRFPRMITHDVYMARDVEGLEPKTYTEDKDNKRFNSIEEFIKSTGVVLEEGGNQPAYNPARDLIRVPRIEQYSSSEEYYRDLFHELGHWSGGKSRLDRKLTRNDKEYAREELIAEMSSGYLCAYFGIEIDQNSVSYLDHWIKKIDADPHLLVSAGQRAEKVFDFFGLNK